MIKVLIGALTSIIAIGSTAAEVTQRSAPDRISVSRSGSQPDTKGDPKMFTGSVLISSQFARDEPARVTGATVTFEPGARTAWHMHPLGQTLIVTAGSGWVQQWGAERQAIHQGDVVWIPANVKHWHGATASQRMTHIAIQERLGTKNVDWLEQVTEEQYRTAPVSRADQK
jgi:quercetin dioxygenase-like cupin family protein